MEELTADEKKRIKDCEGYRSTKRIMQSYSDYSEYEVGTAVFVRDKLNGENRMVGTGYNNSGQPDKFLIINKDGGFLFAKKIISTGKPGTIVSCLTIEYPSDRYELVVDGDYLDAMLLDTEYDPTSSAKELVKKKNKASRINSKNRLAFNTPNEAYEYLKNITIGEVIWSASTTFGNGITKYEVASVTPFVIDRKHHGSTSGWRGSYCPHPHGSHIDYSFTTGIRVTLKFISSEDRYGHYDREIHFYDIVADPKFKTYSNTLYSKKPIKPEDVV